MGSSLIQKKDADDTDFSTVFYFNVAVCCVLYMGISSTFPIPYVFQYSVNVPVSAKGYSSADKLSYIFLQSSTFSCLRSFMPKDEYFELLDRIDIAIFQTYRQCGLGNIYQMIFRNVKLMPEIVSDTLRNLAGIFPQNCLSAS